MADETYEVVLSRLQDDKLILLQDTSLVIPLNLPLKKYITVSIKLLMDWRRCPKVTAD